MALRVGDPVVVSTDDEYDGTRGVIKYFHERPRGVMYATVQFGPTRKDRAEFRLAELSRHLDNPEEVERWLST